MQKIYQNNLYKDKLSACDPEYINQMLLGAYNELAEIQNNTHWKSSIYIKYGWKKHSTCNNDEIKKEIIDCFQFLLGIFMNINGDADEFYEKFKQAINKNNKRVDDDY